MVIRCSSRFSVMRRIEEVAASAAASKLSKFKWQNCSGKVRSAHGRMMAAKRWSEATKKELEAEAQRGRQLAGVGA